MIPAVNIVPALWRRDRLAAYDTETHLSQPGLASPPLVCGSVAAYDGDKPQGKLLSKAEARAYFEALLADETIVIVGANIAFDMLVCAVEAARRGVDLMPLIFKAYRQGRVFDILIAEALHAIAYGTLGRDPRTGMQLCNDEGKSTGRYSLFNVVDVVLGRDNAKVNDQWRKRYALLENTPMDEWPMEARVYPVDDAINTLEVAAAQITGRTHPDGTVAPNRNLHLVQEQTSKAFALHLGGAWGLRTDAESIEELASAYAEAKEESRPEFVAAGFVREDGTEDQSVVKRAVATAYGCTGSCGACAGTGKVPSPADKRTVVCPTCRGGMATCAACNSTGRVRHPKPNLINCQPCNGTGLDLDSAPVPRTSPTEKALAKAEAAGTVAYGNVQIGRDILVESGDELLGAYAQWQEDDKLESTYLPWLRGGTEQPITLSPNAVLDTLRVSYFGPAQLLPRQVSARLSARLRARGAKVLGVRDAIVARLHRWYYSVDYEGGELVTFAESAVHRVGYSKMGEALNAGINVHSLLGSQMLGISYEEFLHRLKALKDPRCKAFRQAAKPINFGVPGSMGAVRIVMNQREQGPDTPHPSGPSMVWDGERFVAGYKGLRFCVLIGGAERCGAVRITEYKDREYPPVCKACVEVAERLRAAAFDTWSELGPYLRWHSDNANNVGRVVHWLNDFERGGVDYGSEANGDFQTGLAIIAGRAQIDVAEEQYADPRSPLHRVSRSIVFAHDELFGEVEIPHAHPVAMRVVEIMVDRFREACPNHRAACKAEPALAPRWWKAMEPVFHRGQLTAWTPEHNPKTCGECAAQKAAA